MKNKHWQTLLPVVIGIITILVMLYTTEIHTWLTTTKVDLAWLYPILIVGLQVLFIYLLVRRFLFSQSEVLKKNIEDIKELTDFKGQLEDEIKEIKQERKFISYIEEYRAKRFYNTMCAAIPIFENGKKTEGYTRLYFYVSDSQPMAPVDWMDEYKKEKNAFNGYLKELDLSLSETERNRLIQKYCIE